MPELAADPWAGMTRRRYSILAMRRRLGPVLTG
jgi:hypothetical protein